jgi:hypothetical protein
MHRMFSNEYLAEHRRLIQSLNRKYAADQSGARDTVQTLKRGASLRGTLKRNVTLNELTGLFDTVGQVAGDAAMTPYTKAMSSSRDAKRMGRDAGPIGERNLKQLRQLLAEEKAKPSPSQSRIETIEFMIRQNETRGDANLGRDQEWDNPSDQPPDLDDETVREIIAFVEQHDGALAKRLAEIFHFGEEEGEDSREDDEPPYEATTGTGADRDFPPETGRPFGGPAPFKGMPSRYNDGMAGDAASYEQRFPNAARIGLDMPYGPEGSKARYDAFGRPIEPIARTSRGGRGSRSASMAMDAGTSAAEENRYSRVWGGLTDRIGLLG